MTDILAKQLLRDGYRVSYMCFHVTQQELLDYSFPCPVISLPYADLAHPGNKSFYHRWLQEQEVTIIINQRGLLDRGRFFIDDLPEGIRVISVYHSKPFGYQDAYLHTLFADHYSYTGLLKCCAKALLLPYLWFVQRPRDIRRVRTHLEWMISHSHSNVFLSESYIDIVRQRCQLPTSSRMLAIPNPNTYDEPSHPSFSKAPELLYVGRLSAWDKRPHLLLRIWRRVEERHPDWCLIIVGNGEQYQPMQRYIRRHHLQHVRMMGQQDPQPYYQRASIACLTSNYEGFPMTITEAMQHAVIPVVFDTFGASDIIRDRVSGRIIPNNDVEAYAEALHLLISQPELRAEMAQAAYHDAQQFNQHAIYQQWKQLIENIL